MNIFYVNKSPYEAAISLCNKHVVKMIVESAQLLSTAHRVLDGWPSEERTAANHRITRWRLDDARENVLYLSSHVKHPDAIWIRQSIPNYMWLVDHMYALMGEYTHRYGKVHSCFGELSYNLLSPPYNLRSQEFTKIPSCMPEHCLVSGDPVENYRSYYIKEKQRMLQYTNREPPEWLKPHMENV